MRNSYMPDKAGFKALGKSPAMGEVSLKVARDIAGATASTGAKGQYTGATYTVVVGHDNESRAGAIAHEVQPNYPDRQQELLTRTASAMGRRG